MVTTRYYIWHLPALRQHSVDTHIQVSMLSSVSMSAEQIEFVISMHMLGCF